MSTQEINLKEIADAIREKDGTTEPIPAKDFPERIRGIQGGGGIELESIAIASPPDKTAYRSGERFDPAGMVVTATYSNGATLTATGYAVEPAGPLTDGLTAVTVRYTEGGRSAEASQPITVIPQLAGLQITTPPDKTAYRYGERFDPAGMEVSAVYTDGSTRAAEGFAAAPDVFDAVGEQEVTVRFSEDGVTVETAVPVMVGRAVIAAVPRQSGTLTYTGEALSPEWEDFDPIQLTMSGVTQATGAGAYDAEVTPTEFYEWADGTTGARAVPWSIGKAAGQVRLDPETITLNADAPTAVIRVTRAGTGAASAVSSDTDVAAVSVDGTEVTVASVGENSGTAVVTVTVAEDENHLEVSGTCEVTAAFAMIYGAEWDGTSTTKWTRTDAAALFTDPVPYVAGATEYGSPFDDIMPWAGMERVTDAQAGELVAIPKFWYTLEENDGGLKIQIADKETAGFSVSPAHMDRGDGKGERDTVYIGRYHCERTGLKSSTGVNLETKYWGSAINASIHNLGETIWSIDFAIWFTIWLLYLVEFADWNSQATIGGGCGTSRSAVQPGYTDNMPYHTGTTQSSRDSYALGTQYRNIEGLWDNVFDWCEGCYTKDGSLYIALNPNDFEANKNGVNVGAISSGFPSRFAVSSAAGFPMFYPVEAGGSKVTYSCDDWEWSSLRPATLVGSRYEITESGGLFAMTSTEYSNQGVMMGCRLMKLPDPA